MDEGDIREKFETIQRDFASLDKGVSNISIQLADLIRRFTDMELLTRASYASGQVTSVTVTDLTRRVANLEDNNKWLWRTIGAVAISALGAAIVGIVKYGGGAVR